MTPRNLALTLLLGCGTVLAHDYQAGAIAIAHPWSRPTVAAQRAGAGYLVLVNRGPDDRLLAVSVPPELAAGVELHAMTMEGNVMRMRELSTIDLPAGKTVTFEPGGLHLMIVGLKAPLVGGRSFRMTLKFEKAGEAIVDVKVEAPASAGAGGAAAHAKPH